MACASSARWNRSCHSRTGAGQPIRSAEKTEGQRPMPFGLPQGADGVRLETSLIHEHLLAADRFAVAGLIWPAGSCLIAAWRPNRRHPLNPATAKIPLRPEHCSAVRLITPE
jgi:hypothetical protein